jgi:hypothetical protein
LPDRVVVVTPWRRVKNGPFYLDWQRRGVGRICRSSGTTDLRTYRKLVAMLEVLADRGRYDLLEALRDGLVSPLQVWDAYRRERVDDLPTAETMVTAREHLDRWAAGFSGRRAADYRTGINRILRHAPAARLHQLPELVEQDRAASGDQAPGFNRSRAAILACLRDTLKPRKAHSLYRRVVAVAALPERRREERERLSVARAIVIRTQLEPEHGAAWWALCTTGMIASELWSRPWTVLKDRIRIGGTKTAGRTRAVPLVEPITRPTFNRRHLSAALTALGLETYDARRAYAHWMEEAGIPRARRRLYLGHRPADVTDLYEMGELTRYLCEDADQLRRYLSRNQSQRARRLRRA